MGFFRYPGGKSKLRSSIVNKLNKMVRPHYREPFFGGGSVGELMLDKIDHAWINDADPGIYALWSSLVYYPTLLKQLVADFKPSVHAFESFKKDLTSLAKLDSPQEVSLFGFKKLAIHQISYSGLGTKSGGPLGGLSQNSPYKVDCRWSPAYLCKKIDALHLKFSKLNVKCTNLDFAEIINAPGDALYYLDPPYFVKGNNLYQCGFSNHDHHRLAHALRNLNSPWLLSYDDCPEIRQLYSWATTVQEINNVNTITAPTNKLTGKRIGLTKIELLISNW